jgi:hypothetical protein
MTQVVEYLETTTAFARGADEGRVDRLVALEARELAWELFSCPGSAAHRKSAALRPGRANLERQDHVHELLAIARLLHVGDLAAAAIGDAGLRDLP